VDFSPTNHCSPETAEFTFYNLARRLRVPVKGGAGLAEGIEVFPRQDELRADEFGNAIRGPLVSIVAAARRYWFYSADYRLEAQLGYLSSLRKITEQEMNSLRGRAVDARRISAQVKSGSAAYDPTVASFRILDHVGPMRRRSGNYWTKCPSCAQQGRDRSGDNLAICIADPRKYRCWAGCTKEMIRTAVGCPIRTRIAS